jgi:hypothetical protein
MSTHALGNGTRNIGCNVTGDEYALLERAAVQFGSLSALLRVLIVEGATVKIPKVAAEIKAVRRKYGRHAAAAVLLAVGLLAIGQSWVNGEDLRRAKGRTHIALMVKKNVKRGTDIDWKG